MKFSTAILALALIPAVQSIVGCVGSTNRSATAMERSGSIHKNSLNAELGTDRGNGAEDVVTEGSAWFARPDRAIRYCFVFASDFGVGEERVRRAAAEGFSIWSKYIKDKEVFASSGLPIGLTTVSEEMKSCDGSEDLKFYVGVRDEKIDKYMNHFTHPWSIAVRTEYDEGEAWGKGFIYISRQGEFGTDWRGPVPNWQVEMSVEAIMLHEIGHTYVTGHFDGTIMMEQIVQFIRGLELKSPRQRFIGASSIDQRVELFTSTQNSSYLGRLGTIRGDTDSISGNFESLMGRPPVGTISAQVRRLARESYELVVSDAFSREVFRLVKLTGANASVCTNPPVVFKIFYESPRHSPGGIVSRMSASEIATCSTLLMKLITKSGNSMLVQVDSNLANFGAGGVSEDDIRTDQLTIKRIDSDQVEYLFVSTL